jgi:hypothetical protein
VADQVPHVLKLGTQLDSLLNTHIFDSVHSTFRLAQNSSSARRTGGSLLS